MCFDQDSAPGVPDLWLTAFHDPCRRAWRVPDALTRGLNMSQPRRILEGSHKHHRSLACRRRGDRIWDQFGSGPAGGRRDALGPKEVVAGGWARRGGRVPAIFAFSTPRGMGSELPDQDTRGRPEDIGARYLFRP